MPYFIVGDRVICVREINIYKHAYLSDIHIYIYIYINIYIYIYNYYDIIINQKKGRQMTCYSLNGQRELFKPRH